MKLRYRQRIFLYLGGLFLLLACITVVFSFNEKKKLRKEIFTSDQKVYAQILDHYIVENDLYPSELDQLNKITHLFPEKIWILVLDENGDAIFHNFHPQTKGQNFSDKIEIRQALAKGQGISKRRSVINEEDFLFYAYNNESNKHIIRVGIPYDYDVITFLSSDNSLIYFLILSYAVAFLLFILLYFYQYNSHRQFASFVHSFTKDKKVMPTNLPDEWDEIALLIKKAYEQLDEKEKNIIIEREKLLEHFQYSEEGISFFTQDYINIYTNSNFIQYLNILLSEPTFDVNNLFTSRIFSEVAHFVGNPENDTVFTTKIHGNGGHFFIRVIIFDDKSFEIIIRDITEEEKAYFDKSEMTNNIAHEIKTPITSIRGYLETLMEYPNLPDEKRQGFVQRSYNQTIRLSNIVQDVILLSKTSDARQHFELEDVNLCELLNQQVKEDCLETIEKVNGRIILNIQPDVSVKGNRTLLYSLFFNLGMNALKYGGDNVVITINNYMEDDEYYYFSFSDNGPGISEKHLSFIFERFYRIDEGRPRDKGGSGLGLSIVKEAVTFHHGSILAKNRSEGGLEYLFTLRKH